MSLLLALTLNFAVNIPNDSYFIALRNRSSAKLHRVGEYIELLLLENECYERFRIPIENKTSFSYNWTENSVDGIQLIRYDGNCNISKFDYGNVIFNETCSDREVLYQSTSSTYDNIEYFICFLIPLLLLARSDNIYKLIQNRLRNRMMLGVENAFVPVAEDIINIENIYGKTSAV